MTATLFISDLHLDASRPQATDTFLQFLKQEAASAEALYILGDLFELWVADDDPNPHNQTVMQAIAALTASGVPCFFMRGNRDLIVGERFAALTGMTVLPDPTLIYVQGDSVLISHGDIFCTDDTGYQRYRKIVTHPLGQAFYNNWPFWLRNRFVQKIRSTSKNSHSSKPREIMDVNQAALEAALRNYDVATLLLGHTHRPAIHKFEMSDSTASMATRIVLGDWYEQGSMLRWDHDGPQLCKLDY